jgi:hypothetical protein
MPLDSGGAAIDVYAPTARRVIRPAEWRTAEDLIHLLVVGGGDFTEAASRNARGAGGQQRHNRGSLQAQIHRPVKGHSLISNPSIEVARESKDLLIPHLWPVHCGDRIPSRRGPPARGPMQACGIFETDTDDLGPSGFAPRKAGYGDRKQKHNVQRLLLVAVIDLSARRHRDRNGACFL